MPETQLSDCFVARTQPYRERWAAENCLRAGYAFYLPEVIETKRIVKRGIQRREFQTKPLFPTYLFVSASSNNGQWHELLRTFGVVALIPGSGGNPAIMRKADLTRLYAWRDESGFIRLPKKGFDHGDTARITRGAYAGYEGLVQGLSPNDRIQILLDYMGRKVPFLVREDDLEPVDVRGRRVA